MRKIDLPKDIENKENFLRRHAPKDKGWYSIVENGILVTKPRTKTTAAEKRERKNKSSFWTARKVA